MASPAARFVDWFRSAAPYIHAFRGRTFVVAFGGEVVADGKFVALTHDLNLLASLGVRLVLVHGTRQQIEAQRAAGEAGRFVGGVRVTDEATLQQAKQAAGRLRVEIEALLSMGLPNSPMANADIRVAGGNFVTAQPRGVVDGIDMQYTGEVRKVHADAIGTRLDAGDLVLLSPLGYSPTGEIFNLTMEDVAAEAAIALRADKLLFLTDQPGISDAANALLRELTVSEAQARLQSDTGLHEDTRLYLPAAIKACRAGVSRVHLLSRHLDGALLLELFTHDGVGTMVARDPLERSRQARIDDVGGVLQLIEPLEADGTLVKRSRELLEREIERFNLLEHDGLIVGCAALYPFASEHAAELACLAVHPGYRNAGAGDRLLRSVEARARSTGVKHLFVLTTRAAHWFIERGFAPAAVDALPQQKQQLYNYQRRSQVLIKPL
ncbi:MAG: amino-acid N-acetyltransferase [Burkholderiales bacterium]|nr:amino-acid N-acetyltransferase [Burkholderiales bacterium]